jgi:integrase
MWQLRYYAETGGIRKIKSILIGDTNQYPTKSRARAKAHIILLQANKSCDEAPQADITMAQLIDRFIVDERLEEIKADKSGLLPATVLKYSTACSYLNILNRHIKPIWGDTLVKAIRPAAVQDWLVRLLGSPKSKKNIKAVFHRLYEKAMLWEVITIQRNPIDLVEVKGISKRRKRPTVLTVDQFYSLLKVIPDPYRTMVVVAQCSGLRVSEILALKWSDIDFRNLTLKVTRGVINGRINRVKTEYSEDYLPLDPQFAAILQAWKSSCPRSPQEWVFPNPTTSRPYHASPIQQDYIRKAALQAGLANVGWHTFRHTYRSWLDATGAPVGVQQKLMRHAQVATTMNDYGDALMDSKREANSKVVRLALRPVYGA